MLAQAFNEFNDMTTNWSPWIKLGIINVVAGILLFQTFYTVDEYTAAVVQRFGKHLKISRPGLRVKVPFIDRVVEHVDLSQKQQTSTVGVKSAKNEFLSLPVTVRYRVDPAKVYEAYYMVQAKQIENIIESIVLNAVKSVASGMTMDEIFAATSQIKDQVEGQLSERFSPLGLIIEDVLVDDPKVPTEIMSAFNDVVAATQRKLSAERDAEALRIKMMGEAEAEAGSLEIKAKALVSFRDTIASGNAAAIAAMTEGTGLTSGDVLHYFIVVDTNDAVRDAAGKGATVVVATGRPNDALYAGIRS